MPQNLRMGQMKQGTTRPLVKSIFHDLFMYYKVNSHFTVTLFAAVETEIVWKPFKILWHSVDFNTLISVNRSLVVLWLGIMYCI